MGSGSHVWRLYVENPDVALFTLWGMLPIYAIGYQFSWAQCPKKTRKIDVSLWEMLKQELLVPEFFVHNQEGEMAGGRKKVPLKSGALKDSGSQCWLLIGFIGLILGLSTSRWVLEFSQQAYHSPATSRHFPTTNQLISGREWWQRGGVASHRADGTLGAQGGNWVDDVGSVLMSVPVCL